MEASAQSQSQGSPHHPQHTPHKRHQPAHQLKIKDDFYMGIFPPCQAQLPAGHLFAQD